MISSWRKHNLEIIDIFNEDATMNSFGLHYQGKDRFVVMQKSKRIRNFRALAKTEAYLNKVGTSERTAIEPRLSDQWFLKMEDLVKCHKKFWRMAKLNCIQTF
jgi:valyl-tRNA synthetase